MAKNKPRRKPARQTAVSHPIRVLIALVGPLAGALLLSTLAANLTDSGSGNNTPFYAGLGVTAWFIGLRWYGIPGMGLRGKRPLLAGVGFATMGWLAFLLFRFLFVDILEIVAGSGRTFAFLLLFEAFAVQLWLFGVLFHAIADWRGPLTAAVSSGILFGAAAYTLFQEAFSSDASAIVYFVAWGIFYGIIRLRTGSILGIVLIQTIHSFTGWIVLPPFPDPQLSQLRVFYLVTAAAYAIFIWRLWPKEEADYRV